MDRDNANEQIDLPSENNDYFVRKRDVLVVAILLFVGVISLLVVLKLQKNGVFVVARINREETLRVSLDKDQSYLIDTEYGVNTLVVQDGEAYVVEADCPDKICEKYKPISKTSESIVCIPHRLIISIEE